MLTNAHKLPRSSDPPLPPPCPSFAPAAPPPRLAHPAGLRRSHLHELPVPLPRHPSECPRRKPHGVLPPRVLSARRLGERRRRGRRGGGGGSKEVGLALRGSRQRVLRLGQRPPGERGKRKARDARGWLCLDRVWARTSGDSGRGVLSLYLSCLCRSRSFMRTTPQCV